MNSITVYLKPERSTVVNTSKVKLEDVVKIYCIDPEIKQQIANIVIYTFHEQMDGRQIVTVLKVIEEINKVVPNAKVINLGDPEFIIFHKKPAPVTRKSKLIEKWKIFFVCLVSFFGSAFTIMTYNTDVSIDKLFNNLYELFMGHLPVGGTTLHLGYAIGLTIGLFFFFNHVANHRLTDDPTPLEVEMRLYERDVNDTVAISSGRNQKSLDVE